MLCYGSARSARPLQRVASLHSSTVLMERGGKPGEDSHAKGGDGNEASSASGSKKAPSRSVSMTEKDKPDPVDLVSLMRFARLDLPEQTRALPKPCLAHRLGDIYYPKCSKMHTPVPSDQISCSKADTKTRRCCALVNVVANENTGGLDHVGHELQGRRQGDGVRRLGHGDGPGV